MPETVQVPHRGYYLGRVHGQVRRLASGYHFASVEPLIESDPAGTTWLGPISDPVHLFETRGLVHWHDAPRSLVPGSVWQFRIEEHPEADRERRPEHYQLRDPEEPIEVVDLRGWANQAELRSLAAGQGIHIPLPPIARRVLLWIADNRFIGPVSLRPDGRDPSWTVAATDASRLDVWSVPPASVNRVECEGLRLLIAPIGDLGSHVGYENWAPDADVARTILKRLRRFDRAAVDARAAIDRVFTDRVFLDHINAIERAGLTDRDLAIERARLDRLQRVIAAIERDAQLLDEAVEVLLASDRVRSALDRRVEQAYEIMLAQRRAAVEASVADTRAELGRLESAVTDRQAALAAVHGELEAKQRQLEERVASFDAALAARLKGLAERPEETFAELAILRTALAPIADTPPTCLQNRTQLPGLRELRDTPEREGLPLRQVSDGTMFRANLAARALAAALDPLACLDAHAAFVTGSLPIVVGDRAYDLLRTYADVVTGGRLLWIPVGASVVEPQDLIARLDPRSGRLAAHPAGLLDLLLEARGSDRMHLVVLDGVNRAPVESYLFPAIESAAGARAGDPRRAIPLVAPGALALDAPYQGIHSIQWPPNVLLAAIPVSGVAALPLPAEIWRKAVLIAADGENDASASRMPQDGNSDESEARPTEIRRPVWDQIVRTSAQVDLSPLLSQACAMPAFATRLQRGARREDPPLGVYAALVAQGLPHEEAMRRAFATAMIPRFAGDASVLEDTLRALALHDLRNWPERLAEAERLSR